MKQLLKSKAFLAAVLSASCIGILAACWYVSRDRTADFKPEGTETTAESQDWQETSDSQKEPSKTETDAYTPPAQPETTESLESYPKVESEAEDEVVVDFTPTEKPEETPPEAPDGKTIMEDPGPEHPVNPVPEVTAPATEAPADKEPEPGSVNENGAVYDPVFGWVVPSQVTQSTMDSDGDPNKMVGNMGN